MVTTVRLGTTSAGAISAATARASSPEQWKKFGITCSWLASVMTFESGMIEVRQSLPSRRGSTTSGNRPTIRAATFR